MKKYLVQFEDIFDGESEEDVYEQLLNYMEECVRCGDVTVFDIEKMELE